MVGRFYGMLHLSAEHSRSLVRREDPYERRFGEPLKGPIIPFGSLVEYYTISAKDQSRIHQLGKKVLPGLFLGYALYAGGIWKGDVHVHTHFPKDEIARSASGPKLQGSHAEDATVELYENGT